MKKSLFIAGLAFAAMPLFAQETYENTLLIDNDLNGTARYVGMGGAMDALGADLSTISSNPAGIGLFRRSMIQGSFGVVSQEGVNSFTTGKKTNLSFDQLGFVYAMRTGARSFFNFGFNYHKSRNFTQILSAADAFERYRVNGVEQYISSQNKQTYEKLADGYLYDWKTITDGGNEYQVPDENRVLITHSQLDNIYYNALIKDENGDFGYNPATEYNFNRAMRGYIGEYDFNFSGNIRDRVYLGLTIGIHDVNYKGYSEYTEQMDANSLGITSLTAVDEREITGHGVDIKAGIIFRPVEDSPFRVGISVATPTWYDLTTRNYTYVTDGNVTCDMNETYDFKVYTPWKFGLSLGHTIGDYLAIGAGYEYADYSSMDTRVITGSNYDWYYDDYYDESASDENMNLHTQKTLRGVSTLKLGAEYKPDPALAVRIGYNYVAPLFEDNAQKDPTIASKGTYCSSTTDFTNWKGTNRITCGLGYTSGNMTFDVAYQYNVQKGDFSPFSTYTYGEIAAGDNANADDNLCRSIEVTNKRHQLLFTVGYKF